MTGLPPGPLMLDTGIYIRFSRGQGYPWLNTDKRIFRRTILTAVVAAELYAGTRDRHEKQDLDELCRAHGALGSLTFPSAAAWVEAGLLVRRARAVWGEMEFARHFRDVLIALEAIRAGAALVTENWADFARWRNLLRSAGRSLQLFDPSRTN